MKHKTFAPVFIPTLCRHRHFKRCVESLSRCTYADQTDLIIGLDYPLKDEHWDGYDQIKDYLKLIKGFKSVTVFEREENYGVVKNFTELRKWVLERYDRCILTEDDNEFSPNFLDYMNSCLDKYKNNNDVLGICGYNRMIDMSGYDYHTYAAISYSAWGSGFMRKQQQFLLKEVINKEYALSIVKSWKKSWEIYKSSSQLLSGLLSIVKTGHVTGDTLVVSYMILNQKLCIFPSISKVRNHGLDGGGEHSGSDLNHPTLTQTIDTNGSFEPDDIEIENNKIINHRRKQWAIKNVPLHLRLIFKVYIPLRYLIYRFIGFIIYK